MSAIIQHNRGDVFLGEKAGLKDGQLFLSYVNKDIQTSIGHSYSEGQLWVKDPSSSKLTEIANARSIDSMRFRGFLDDTFDGDFVNTSEVLRPDLRHCHTGDFWVFSAANKKLAFQKSDILLITKAEYTYASDGPFRETLKNVEYLQIRGTNLDGQDTDLDAQNIQEAIIELTYRLYYRGTVSDSTEFYNLSKRRGNLYIATKAFSILKTQVDYPDIRDLGENSKYVQVHTGDLLLWNSKTWVLIPTGREAVDIPYTANLDELEAVGTFDTEHLQQFTAIKNVQQALDILNKSKAQLDSTGKVPFNQLPESVRSGMSLQGKFFPILNTAEDKDDHLNQANWPTPINEGLRTGMYWIVDCQHLRNVQYRDKASGKILELNSADFVVYVKYADGSYEWIVIDNSDRIAAIDVETTETREITSLNGTIGLKAGDSIKVHIEDNTIVVSLDGSVIAQDVKDIGKPDYVPIYNESGSALKNSELRQDLDKFISELAFQFGNVRNAVESHSFGNFGIDPTAGATKSTYNNHYFFINSMCVSAAKNAVFARKTNLRASELNNFADGQDEVLDIFFPEHNSILVGIYDTDWLGEGYHTKTDKHGFITDTLTSEILLETALLKENFQDGFENIGIGRTTTEDLESSEITFYSKSKDYDKTRGGFYTLEHAIKNKKSHQAELHEHFLSRSAVRTHLVIHPTILEDEIETFVNMPVVSGTLLTWEELFLVFAGSKGTPLMIPAWELLQFRHRQFIGLDTSPITMRVNRKKHDNTVLDRENNLGTNYGEGKESTWSYIDSSRAGSIQEDERGPIDDVLTFDAWLEVQRSVATKEAFIIPSSSRDDGQSTVDDDTLEYTDDEAEVGNPGYGTDKHGGFFQRILPSRTIYKDEPVYYSPFTQKLIPQQRTDKDIEMPAVGGVLLTSRSRIEGGVWWPIDEVDDGKDPIL